MVSVHSTHATIYRGGGAQYAHDVRSDDNGDTVDSRYSDSIINIVTMRKVHMHAINKGMMIRQMRV